MSPVFHEFRDTNFDRSRVRFVFRIVSSLGRRWSPTTNGSKVHAAVDTLGNLLALKITAANEQERSQFGELAEQVQQVTGGTVEVAYADQGNTGEEAASQAEARSIELEIVKHTEAKRGFVLLPKRWVVERTFGWLGRFRRLARDYERLADPQTRPLARLARITPRQTRAAKCITGSHPFLPL